jgi:hypothetical protein
MTTVSLPNMKVSKGPPGASAGCAEEERPVVLWLWEWISPHLQASSDSHLASTSPPSGSEAAASQGGILGTLGPREGTDCLTPCADGCRPIC